MSESFIHLDQTNEQLHYHPALLGEAAASYFYLWPEQSAELEAELRARLHQYHQIRGWDSTHTAVEYQTNRTLYRALSAPLYHLIELEADQRFLQAMDGPALDAEAYVTGIPNKHQPLYPFTGEYRQFLTTAGAVNATAATTIVQAIKEDTHHPYRPVWDLLASVLPEFAKTELQLRGWQRPIKPEEDLVLTVSYLNEESTFRALMALALHFRINEGLEGRNLTSRLMQSSEQLAWSSTAKRTFFSNAFARAEEEDGTSASCPYKLGKTAVFNTGPRNTALWARKSLEDGPLEVTGFCPASIELQPPSREGQGIIEAMFAVRSNYTERRIINRLAGGASSAELGLIRDIILLDHTVIKIL